MLLMGDTKVERSHSQGWVVLPGQLSLGKCSTINVLARRHPSNIRTVGDASIEVTDGTCIVF